MNEKTMPRVSVIIPHHNRPDMLMQAVDSVRAQTWAADEIIVVDNASDFEIAAAVLGSLESEGVRVIRRGKAAESPAALYNDGIEASTGDVLMFLDDDNQMLPPRIQLALKGLFSTKSGCLYTAMEAISAAAENATLIPKLPNITTIRDPKDGNPLPIDLVHVNDLAIMRWVIDDIGGFDEALFSSIGLEWVIRANRAGLECKYMPIPAVLYRIWEGQRSMLPDYYAIDKQRSRPYIAAKECGMRKQLKVWIWGSTDNDPYVTSAIKSIPWITTQRLVCSPLALVQRLRKGVPNYVLHPDLRQATDGELKMLSGLNITTIGCAADDKMETPAQHTGWAEAFPAIDWYVTTDDCHGRRERVCVADTAAAGADPVAFWTRVLGNVRCNRRFDGAQFCETDLSECDCAAKTDVSK